MMGTKERRGGEGRGRGERGGERGGEREEGIQSSSFMSDAVVFEGLLFLVQRSN